MCSCYYLTPIIFLQHRTSNWLHIATNKVTVHSRSTTCTQWPSVVMNPNLICAVWSIAGYRVRKVLSVCCSRCVFPMKPNPMWLHILCTSEMPARVHHLIDAGKIVFALGGQHWVANESNDLIQCVCLDYRQCIYLLDTRLLIESVYCVSYHWWHTSTL